jgi:hypothetical protein
MGIESSILKSLRAAGEPVAINELAIVTGTDTNDTAAMQKLRNALRGMVHKRQLLSRNGLDGILRYMLPGSPVARVASVPQPDADAAQQASEIRAAAECPGDSTPAPEGTAADKPDVAVGRLGTKTLLVFQALREGEWVERGTLDFRTKLSMTEVLTGLTALRKRGLVVSQGTKANTLWARADAATLAHFDQAAAFMERVSEAMPKAVALVAAPAPKAVLPSASPDSDEARRYRWLIENADISFSFGGISMRSAFSPKAGEAKVLWDAAIDTMLSMAPARTEVSA